MSSPHLHGPGCGCSDEVKEQSVNESLLAVIDRDRIRCLNEKLPGSGRNPFKAWSDRFDSTHVLESDVDDELLLFVPFVSTVKLKSIAVLAAGDTTPKLLNVWINRDDLDMSSVNETPPLQTFHLNEDTTAALDYPTKLSKFQNVSSLVMHFKGSDGGEKVLVQYIGLKGENTQARKGLVNFVYESRSLLTDHPVPDQDHSSKEVQ